MPAFMLGDFETIARLLLAAIAGSIIGFERERLLWAAGLRTHMLVCVGACLIMIVSAYGFSDVLGAHVILDPSRVAAQVVSGIGFIGAGTILFRGEIVRGLTTAASLWAVAALGLAIGGGLYLAAGATTLIVLFILAGIKPFEERYRERIHTRGLRLTVRRGGMSTTVLRQVAGDHFARVRQFVVQQSGTEGLDDVKISFARLSPKAVDDIALKLKEVPDVVSVETDVA